jgi:hypothetical protein
VRRIQHLPVSARIRTSVGHPSRIRRGSVTRLFAPRRVRGACCVRAWIDVASGARNDYPELARCSRSYCRGAQVVGRVVRWWSWGEPDPRAQLCCPVRHGPAALTQAAGVWDSLHRCVLDELGRDGLLDWSRVSIDSVSVRAKRGVS